MRLSDVAQLTRGKLWGPDQEVMGVSIDSRSIKPGETFVALRGPNFDGHDFIATAQNAGAKAGVVQKYFADISLSQVVVEDTYLALRLMATHTRAAFNGKVAAITGSCGKTTVKGFLYSICEQAGSCVATKGNLNNLIGVPLSLLRLHHDVNYGVFEAGTSVPGEIAALAEMIQADVALVNNVMPTHVEGFGSVDNIALEKTELFAALKGNGVAVINLDDERVNYFIERSQHTHKIGFSTNSQRLKPAGFEALVVADNITSTDVGAAIFTLTINHQSTKCQLQVLGEHNVANALAAAATAFALGINLQAIVRGLEAFQGEARRMQIRRSSAGETLIDDTYNASPGSVKAAINFLERFANSVLVLGDMGELGLEAAALHREIGAYAKQAGISSLYATGILAAEAVNTFGTGAVWYESQSELIEKLRLRENREAIILVKGSRFMRMDKVVDALCHKEGEN